MTNRTLITISAFCFFITNNASADIDQGKEAYFMGEYERAIREFMPDAEDGNTYAQIKIGQMYENGWGTERDFAAAKGWYEQAATRNDPLAHVALAKLYAYGRGVIKDYNTAEGHLLSAAGLGYNHAYYILGDIHNDDYAFGHNDRHALKYYIMAAQNDAAANSYDGHFRKGAGQWFRLITPKGVQATRRLADEGNVYAQFNTGLRYYFGEGVGKNHTTANSYFLMAAHAGNAEAQNYLAQNRVLEDPQNFDKVFVYKWFSISAANGFTDAMVNLERIKQDMTPEEINMAQSEAQEWLEKNSN